MRTYVKTAPVVVVLLLAYVTAAFAAQGPRNLPPGFEAFPVGSGLTLVTAMDFAPDGRLFVCEHNGSLRIVKNDEVLPTPFMTIPVHNFSEQGLLGVAFDPNFATNRYLYVSYTSPSAQNRVSRFRASATNPDVVEPNSELVLLDNISGGDGVHNGGGIHCGPDGMLYVT